MQDYSTPEYWNERAKHYKGQPSKCLFNDLRFHQFEVRTINMLSQLVKFGDDVLDVACGYGRLAKHISIAGNWYGIDFSDEMHSQTESEFQPKIFRGDATRPTEVIPISRKFNVIFQANSGKVLQLSPAAFRDLYAPFLDNGGTIACLEADVFTIYPFYR